MSRVARVRMTGRGLGLAGLLAVAVAAGCAGGGGGSIPSASTAGVASAAHAAPRLRTLSVNPSPAPQSLCIGGTLYKTTEDDEFSQDKVLNSQTDFIMSTPGPNGAMWSTKALGFANGGTRNNVGVDDAYYTNSTLAPGFNPFSFSNSALNIETEPVPKAYATASALDGAHWLSGVLEGPAKTYGFVEVSAKMPNLQGFWPAPLWLLGLAGDDGKGDGYEELDAVELFGNSFGSSVIQQTQKFSLTAPTNYVRGVVSPDPSTTYHTYGVLWTPQTVTYYYDRVPTSPAFPNSANGPANPLIILQVFSAAYGAALPPATQTPQTMQLQYFRWYQTTSTSCAPAAVAAAVSTYPTPTPAPTFTPVPGAPTIVQKSTVADVPSSATMTGAFKTAPKTGDLLLAIMVTQSAVTTPTGWVQIDGSSGEPGFMMYAGVVGANGLKSATSYAFGTNVGIIQLFDISGASTTSPGVVGADPAHEVLSSITRTLTIPKAKGLLLSVWSGLASNRILGLDEILPSGQRETPLTYSIDNAITSGGSIGLRVSQIIGEPYAAAQPYTLTGTSAILGSWAFDGDLVWIAPAQ